MTNDIVASTEDGSMIKFIYSEKATKFCENFTLLLTVKSKVKISQNYVAFSEYMNSRYGVNIWYLMQKR